MIPFVNWLRILLLGLALVSFIIGMVLKDALEFPDNLTLTLVTEAFDVIIYSWFALGFNAESHHRVWRLIIRIVMAFLTIYGPVKALGDCSYSSIRDLRQNQPGFHYYDRIRCEDDSRRAQFDGMLLPTFRLFRVRCIILITVFALMVVEMVCYGRSHEGVRRPREGVKAETQQDLELANTVGEPQKMVLPDPPKPIAGRPVAGRLD